MYFRLNNLETSLTVPEKKIVWNHIYPSKNTGYSSRDYFNDIEREMLSM